MIKEFNKFKLNHNQFDAGVRGVWRKFNPYNPDAGLEEEQTKDLKVESLDDLFDDDNVKDDNTNDKNKNDNALKADSLDEIFDDNKQKTTNKTNMTDSELDELLFDDFENGENDTESNNDILDIQKELEAKFDELFGPIDDDE